jgi:hypothetical protein
VSAVVVFVLTTAINGALAVAAFLAGQKRGKRIGWQEALAWAGDVVRAHTGPAEAQTKPDPTIDHLTGPYGRADL